MKKVSELLSDAVKSGDKQTTTKIIDYMSGMQMTAKEIDAFAEKSIPEISNIDWNIIVDKCGFERK